MVRPSIATNVELDTMGDAENEGGEPMDQKEVDAISVRDRRSSSVEIDKDEIDKWDQMLVYGAGKSEINGVFVKYTGPEAPTVGSYVYVRQLEDIAESPEGDRFWLWRTNMEVKFHQQECWKISKLPPWALEDNPTGHLEYLYYCLSDDLCPPSVGWKAFDSADHCPEFKMLPDNNIEISGSIRRHLNAVYEKQDDGSWMNNPTKKAKKRRAWIYRAEGVQVGTKEATVWQVADYPPKKIKKKSDKYFYRIITDSDELPEKSADWKEQEHRAIARPAPLVEPRKWNSCHVTFGGRDAVTGRYTRTEVPDYKPSSFKGNFLKGDGLEVNSGLFERKEKGGHFYFRQDKPPHHLLYMLDQKSTKKTRHWVITTPDSDTRIYIAAQESKMANLVQYPPTFGWSCNPDAEPVDAESSSEEAETAQSVNVDGDESSSESESESDSGERSDNFKHPDWPPPVVTNTMEKFKPEYVVSFRVENYGYHLKLVRDTIEMIANVDPETGEEEVDGWYEVFEDNETGDPNFNKMPYKPDSILRYIKNARIHYQLRLSEDKKHIFCFLSTDDINMKRWASYMDHDLMLDPANAINIGRHEVAMLLAKRTLKEGEDNSQVGANFILQGVNDVVDWVRDELCCGLVGCILELFQCSQIMNFFSVFFFDKAQVHEDCWDNVYVQYSEVTREEVYTRYNIDTTDIQAAEEPILKIDDAKYENGSIFSPRHRLRIVYEMLTGECFDDPSLPSGGQLRVEEFALNYNHPIEAVFALHDKGIYEELQDNFNWWGVMNPNTSKFNQSMKEIRNYYGEEIGYYFAFMRQYTQKLAYPAVLGIVFFILQLQQGHVAIPGISLYVAIVIIWSVIFMEWWERYEKELSNSWGMTRFARKALPRPQFHGQKVISNVNGKVVEEHRFKATYYCGLCVSYSTVFFFVSIVLVVVVQLFVWRDNMGDQVYYSMMIGAINAVMIQVFNILYAMASYYLNEWENHRLQPEWDKSMVWKKILFYIVNSFSSLFYIAFIREVDGHTNEDKLKELQIQLGSLFISMIVVQNITERLLNPIMDCIFDTFMPGPSYDGLDEIDHFTVIQAEISQEDIEDAEQQIEMYASPELLDQMAELVVQYGYVTLFVMAFPLAPFLALINNYVEAHVDTQAWKEAQRPIPKGAVGNGEWNTVLELFSYMSVLTNIALISFRTGNVDDNFNIDEENSTVSHIWFFACGCAAIYFMIVLTKFLNVAALFGNTDIDEHIQRSLEIEKNLVAKALKPKLGDGTINPYTFKRVDLKYWKVYSARGRVHDKFTAFLMEKDGRKVKRVASSEAHLYSPDVEETDDVDVKRVAGSIAHLYSPDVEEIDDVDMFEETPDFSNDPEENPDSEIVQEDGKKDPLDPLLLDNAERANYDCDEIATKVDGHENAT